MLRLMAERLLRK